MGIYIYFKRIHSYWNSKPRTSNLWLQVHDSLARKIHSHIASYLFSPHNTWDIPFFMFVFFFLTLFTQNISKRLRKQLVDSLRVQQKHKGGLPDLLMCRAVLATESADMARLDGFFSVGTFMKWMAWKKSQPKSADGHPKLCFASFQVTWFPKFGWCCVISVARIHCVKILYGHFKITTVETWDFQWIYISGSFDVRWRCWQRMGLTSEE